MVNQLEAIVFAGGTREPIDDVRVITNLSTGRFGITIARALARRGVRVTLAASTGVVEPLDDFSGAPGSSGQLVRFASYANLAEVIDGLAKGAAGIAALVFMAAAVSDFSPVRSEGKISSDQEEITITMRRNPKLLARFREQFGLEAYLVGFKLTSGLRREEMLEKARKQLEACKLDLVVANDLKNFENENHPVTLLTPGGETVELVGTRNVVAEQLVEDVLARVAGR
ncbi:MAG: phosphopantothenoylcysteine decarboxylase [Patescibacteria group bacterium]|jgi:phosphopantothenoylcysteine decarboxylase/phosphopantothenate--cysteine ligase